MLLAALLTALFALPAARVRFDASAESWFLPSDPARIAAARVQELFGSEEILVAVLDRGTDSVFSPEVLTSLRRAGDAIAELPEVTDVRSLATLEVLHGDRDTVRITPAVRGLPVTQDDATLARDAVLASPLARRTLLPRDEALTLLVIAFSPGPDAFERRFALVDRIEAVLEDERVRHGIAYRLTGDAVLQRGLYHKVRHDLVFNTSLALLIILAVFVVAFRSAAAAALAGGVVVTALVIARGTQGLLGWPDNSILSIAPIVILVIGVADAVHVLDRYFTHRAGGSGAHAAARAAVTELFRPCALTSLTTAAGFLAVATSPLAPLRQLGVLAALGVIAAFVISVVALPAALCLLFPAPRSSGAPSVRVRRALLSLPDRVARHRFAVRIAALGVAVLALVGIARVEIDSDYLELFWPDDPLRRQAEWVDERIGGIASIEAIVTSRQAGGLLEPEALRALRDIGESFEAHPALRGTTSVIDPLLAMGRAMQPQAEDPMPTSRALAAQYLLLYELASDVGISDWIDPTHTTARLRARMRLGRSSELSEWIEEVSEGLDAHAGDGLEVEMTGGVVLFKNLGDYVVRSQLGSFAVALTLVTACMLFVFRSLRLGLLSLIPNLWPVAVALGTMGFAGWWLQPATAMVAAVVLGIAVDDTIHFLDAFVDARRSGSSRAQATRAMFERAGGAISLTTLILTLGFGAMLFSDLKDTVHFAALCIIALCFAWIGDALVLPALLDDDPSEDPARGQPSPPR